MYLVILSGYFLAYGMQAFGGRTDTIPYDSPRVNLTGIWNPDQGYHYSQAKYAHLRYSNDPLATAALTIYGECMQYARRWSVLTQWYSGTEIHYRSPLLSNGREVGINCTGYPDTIYISLIDALNQNLPSARLVSCIYEYIGIYTMTVITGRALQGPFFNAFE